MSYGLGVLCSALTGWTKPTEVKLGALHLHLTRQLSHSVEGSLAQRDVDDGATCGADEMSVRRDISIVVGIALVDAERLHHPTLGEQSQRVVHRGARERGIVGMERSVDVIYIGMRVMLHEVVQDSNTLWRSLNAASG